MSKLLFTLFSAAFASAYASLSDCSNGESLFKLTSMSFSPDPTVPGLNSTLLLSMDVPSEITNGTATYAYTYNFLPFSPTVDPLCDVTVPCPIQVGVLNTRSSYPISPDLNGSLKIKVSWSDLNGNLLMCVLINTKLGNNKQLAVFKKFLLGPASRSNISRY